MKKKYTYILTDKRKTRASKHSLRTKITIVMVIVSIGFYLLWAVGFMSNQTRVRQAMLDISRIKHAARLFRADFGRCPDSLEELETPPGDFKYVRGIVDPWGRPYRLVCPSGLDPGGVDVQSGGPDRVIGGSDAVSSL